MTAPDVERPARGDPRARRPASSSSIRAAPRPPSSPTEHLFIRPGTDALLLLAMLHVLFAEEPSARPAGSRRHRRRRRAARGLPSACAARARRRRARASPPRRSARLARDVRDRAARRVLRPHRRLHAGVRRRSPRGSCYVLNVADRQPRRARAALMFTTPAVDLAAAGRALGQRGALRAVEEPRARPARVRRRAAGRRARRGDRDARAAGRSARSSRSPATPCCRRPNGPRLERALAGARLHGLDRSYLNETTRHAHVILPPTVAARALALRPRAPRVRGAQRREVLAAAVPARRRAAPRLGDPARAGRRGSRRRRGGAASARGSSARAAGTARSRGAARPRAAHRAVRRRALPFAHGLSLRAAARQRRTASISARSSRACPTRLAHRRIRRIHLAPAPPPRRPRPARARAAGARAANGLLARSAGATCAATTRGCTTASGS